MAALQFTLKEAPPERLDLKALTPTGLAGLSRAEIEALPIGTTRTGVALGAVFAVAGSDPSTIALEGDARLDNVGHGLAGGSIHVDGHVGAYLGRGMKSGSITVTGSATGPHAGAQMTGGTIRIDGDAAEATAGAVPGAMHGMAGGLMTIGGNAGRYLGDRMRRGVIVVLGSVGEAAASRMVGGTIVAGAFGARAGVGMKRGTLIGGSVEDLEPTFVPSGTYDAAFLAILAKYLQGEWADAADLVPARAARYRGDMAALGKGEILVAL